MVQVVAFIASLQITADCGPPPVFHNENRITGTQLRGQRHSFTVMMVLSWRERWQQYAEQMEDGAPLQSAGKLEVVL